MRHCCEGMRIHRSAGSSGNPDVHQIACPTVLSRTRNDASALSTSYRSRSLQSIQRAHDDRDRSGADGRITQYVAEVGRQGANQTPRWVAIAKVAVTGGSFDSRSGLMANACRLVLHPLHAVFNVADL
jgi:hypothetical protein